MSGGWGVFIVLVIGLFLGLVVEFVYEMVAVRTRKVPTITEIVQAIIWHFTPDQVKGVRTWKGQVR